jgi:hypothetical protein
MLSWLVSLVVLAIALVIVATLAKWVLDSWHVTVPAPLLKVAGLVVVLVVILWLVYGGPPIRLPVGGWAR